MEELTSVFRRLESVPTEVLAAAREAYAWRSVATAIAEVEFDSAIDNDDGLIGVRDAGSERRLRFRGPGSVVNVSVIDGGRRLVGRFEPAMAGSVVLRQPGRASIRAQVDALGQFLFEDLSQGAISLRPIPTDPALPQFETEWVTM
ncbi:MAG TPA: hypothetical protein VG184_04870 [Acidimicrobiales bacterium]|nr:hypothetical protein [Acidimicrobiales bacterium]